MRCTFCGKDIKDFEDFSACPVKDGSCCRECFYNIVNIKRFDGMKGENDGKEE